MTPTSSKSGRQIAPDDQRNGQYHLHTLHHSELWQQIRE